jgi:hypothetical protein
MATPDPSARLNVRTKGLMSFSPASFFLTDSRETSSITTSSPDAPAHQLLLLVAEQAQLLRVDLEDGGRVVELVHGDAAGRGPERRLEGARPQALGFRQALLVVLKTGHQVFLQHRGHRCPSTAGGPKRVSPRCVGASVARFGKRS